MAGGRAGRAGRSGKGDARRNRTEEATSGRAQARRGEKRHGRSSSDASYKRGPADRQGGKGGARNGRPADAGSYIEGRRACAEALDVGIPLRRALVATGDASLAQLVSRLEAQDVPVEEVARQRLDALSSHGAHQGIVCQTAPYRYATLHDVIAHAGEGDALVVVLDHVTDQGNLGAIVRSAEVVGAAGVVIAKARAAGVGVGAYKTSAGAVMHLPVAQVPNLSAAIDELKEAGFWAGAASEHAEQDVWSAPMGGRLALVMGSEGSGVSRLVLEHCDFACRLPQRGRVESLNVAQAATVMCYEWLRRTSADAAEG